MALQFFQNRRIFGNVNASSEKFRTFPVGKGKSFKFYRKVIELAPPPILYRCHNAPGFEDSFFAIQSKLLRPECLLKFYRISANFREYPSASIIQR